MLAQVIIAQIYEFQRCKNERTTQYSVWLVDECYDDVSAE